MLGLKGKLNEEDIKMSEMTLDSWFQFTKIILEISAKYNCKSCLNYDNKDFAYPIGNPNSKIMFINNYTNVNSHIPLTDKGGILFNVLLDKLNLSIHDVYVTSISKCVTEDINTCFKCAATYLLREIDMIKPKVIVTLGETPARVFLSMASGKEYEGLFKELQGHIYTIKDVNDNEYKVIHALDPNVVINSSGALYNNYKKQIWTEINTAVSILNKSK